MDDKQVIDRIYSTLSKHEKSNCYREIEDAAELNMNDLDANKLDEFVGDSGAYRNMNILAVIVKEVGISVDEMRKTYMGTALGGMVEQHGVTLDFIDNHNLEVAEYVDHSSTFKLKNNKTTIQASPLYNKTPTLHFDLRGSTSRKLDAWARRLKKLLNLDDKETQLILKRATPGVNFGISVPITNEEDALTLLSIGQKYYAFKGDDMWVDLQG